MSTELVHGHRVGRMGRSMWFGRFEARLMRVGMRLRGVSRMRIGVMVGWGMYREGSREGGGGRRNSSGRARRDALEGETNHIDLDHRIVFELRRHSF